MGASWSTRYLLFMISLVQEKQGKGKAWDTVASGGICPLNLLAFRAFDYHQMQHVMNPHYNLVFLCTLVYLSYASNLRGYILCTPCHDL